MKILIDTKENFQPFLLECIKNFLSDSIIEGEKFKVTEIIPPSSKDQIRTLGMGE